jgi:hypothetical protein
MTLLQVQYTIPQEIYSNLKQDLLKETIYSARDQKTGIDSLVLSGANARIDMYNPQNDRDGLMNIIYKQPFPLFSFNGIFTFTPLSLPGDARRAIKKYKPIGIKQNFNPTYYSGNLIPSPVCSDAE